MAMADVSWQSIISNGEITVGHNATDARSFSSGDDHIPEAPTPRAPRDVFTKKKSAELLTGRDFAFHAGNDGGALVLQTGKADPFGSDINRDFARFDVFVAAQTNVDRARG